MGEESKHSNRIFVVKVAGGQEKALANLLYSRILARNLELYSIICIESMKGYLLIEGRMMQPLLNLVSGLKYVKTVLHGTMSMKEIENLISPREVRIEFKPEQEVVVISGPFKGMKAKVVRHDRERGEVTILLLDTPYQLQVTVEDSYLKPAEKTA